MRKTIGHLPTAVKLGSFLIGIWPVPVREIAGYRDLPDEEQIRSSEMAKGV
jgi:hypothetical protein